jgi:hypothetical protein
MANCGQGRQFESAHQLQTEKIASRMGGDFSVSGDRQIGLLIHEERSGMGAVPARLCGESEAKASEKGA